METWHSALVEQNIPKKDLYFYIKQHLFTVLSTQHCWHGLCCS